MILLSVLKFLRFLLQILGVVAAHGDEHNHEKKTVLKKVKQKAKKIKDSITKHGHHDHERGHEYHYEDQHIPDDHDLDEEDDEDVDPVHGAPSKFFSSTFELIIVMKTPSLGSLYTFRTILFSTNKF